MAEVEWIKITTDMFDVSRKIKHIERMDNGDTILIIWFKLLTLAGKINDGGAIYVTESIPYDLFGLADELRRPEKIVDKALSVLEMYDMIERDDGFIYISSWEKYQNIEGLDRIREQNRKRVEKHRKKKRLSECNVTSNVTRNVTVTQCNATEEDKEKEIDTEEDKEKREKRETTTPQQIVDLFNSICISFPSVRSLSEARKKAIKARLNTYTLEDFRRCFELAEASSFLKGSNDRNWTATFDWLIKDANMPKVLEGNYDDKAKAAATLKYSNFDPRAALEAAVARSWEEKEQPKTAADDPELRQKVAKLRREIQGG